MFKSKKFIFVIATVILLLGNLLLGFTLVGQDNGTRYSGYKNAVMLAADTSKEVIEYTKREVSYSETKNAVPKYEQLSNLSSENKKTNNSKEESAKREVFAMDTYMTLTAYGENAEKAVNLAEEEITKLDKLLSTGLQTSEINKLNREGTAVLSTDTAYLMEQTLKICKDTKNSFNPAIYPIMELWGFPDKNYSVPTKKQLEKMNLNKEEQLTDASLIMPVKGMVREANFYPSKKNHFFLRA